MSTYIRKHFSIMQVNYISVPFHSMKAGSRDHLNTSSEAINEEDTSGPSDVRSDHLCRNYEC